MENILEIKDLSITFKDFSLDKVSFNLPKGSILGFIGQNGAGKTTTLKLILNSFKRAEGEILVCGKDNIKDEVYVKKNIGYVPAESYLVELRSVENHEETFKYFYEEWDHKKFMEILNKYEIDPNKLGGELSTGMKTKVMFALAIAHNPKVLILDEPTAGLDPVARMEFLDILRDFVEDGERSVIISSHITSDLDKVADYVALIYKGKIVEFDSVDEIQEKYRIVKGNLDEIEGYENDFVGIRKYEDTFEGLIKKEKLVGALKELKSLVPNIEGLLSYHILGGRANENR